MKRILFLLIFCMLNVVASELISPIPFQIEYDKNKANLGKKLFLDPRLSSDNSVSCANCHFLNDGGDDGLTVSYGIEGRSGKINAPTVYNAVFNIAQFWDGRAKNLEHQAFFPIHDPNEMGMKEGALVKKLSKISEYQKLFEKIYADGISMKNIQNAIAEFEKALITPNSKFDQYLRGDIHALNQDEKEGYELFKSVGCISCHNGILLGGNFFQKVGVYENYQVDENLGLYNITGKEEDKNYFKVPTLRNISKTAPYLHSGKIQTLKEVIQIMAYYQLGRELEKEKRDKLYQFLLTLDGEKPEILNEK